MDLQHLLSSWCVFFALCILLLVFFAHCGACSLPGHTYTLPTGFSLVPPGALLIARCSVDGHLSSLDGQDLLFGLRLRSSVRLSLG